MALLKCPRCELNYILDGSPVCVVCHEDVHGRHRHDDANLCSICGEARALPGEDTCRRCRAELQLFERIVARTDEEEVVARDRGFAAEPISSMEEIEDIQTLDQDDESDSDDDQENYTEPYAEAL